MKYVGLCVKAIGLGGLAGVALAGMFNPRVGIAFFVGMCWNTANLACLLAIARCIGVARPRTWVVGGLIAVKAVLLFGVGWLLVFRVSLPVSWLAAGVSVPFLWLVAQTVRESLAYDATRRAGHP